MRWRKREGHGGRFTRRLRIVSAVLAMTAVASVPVVGVPSPAEAGPTGINPAPCTPAETWRFRDYNLQGWPYRLELRHSYACGAVGWARLTRLPGGSGPPLVIALSAWNPGGPGQSVVPGTSYTYTVNGSAGQSVCGGFHAWWVDNFGNRRYIGWFDPGCYRA
jgi:hypothetical protein